MERKRIVAALIAGVVSCCFAGKISAQGGSGPNGFGPRANGRPRLAQRWRELSPEQQQRVKANAARWMQMSPEQRKELRAREIQRRQRMRAEAEAALQNSGLKLEPGQRDLYERRYLQERRRVERALRQEIEEKRQREMAPVVEGLKKEFSDPQGSANSPAASPAPKN